MGNCWSSTRCCLLEDRSRAALPTDPDLVDVWRGDLLDRIPMEAAWSTRTENEV